MSRHHSPQPMLARSEEQSSPAGRSAAAERCSEPETSIPAGAKPEVILERIRTLVTDHSREARRLAVAAAARFPDHAAIPSAKRVLVDGKARVGSGEPEPSTTEEFDWLRHPPESARGKWVALVGSEMVASADSLAELTAALRSKQLPKPALVHHLGQEAELR